MSDLSVDVVNSRFWRSRYDLGGDSGDQQMGVKSDVGRFLFEGVVQVRGGKVVGAA